MKPPIPLSRAIAALGGLAVILFWISPAWAESTPSPPDDDDYIVDDRGRPMRVAFPLHDRITVDVFGSAVSADDPRQFDSHPGMKLAIHHSFEVTYPDDEVWWRFRHRWLSARATGYGDNLRLGMTLLSATYMRHASDSYIVIPSANHAQIPAPFDIAFEYEVFDADFDYRTHRFTSVNVAEFAFLLDFLRDGQYRHRLALGPLMAYEINEDSTHIFTPASGGRLIYAWENAPGRMAINTRLQCAAAATLTNRELEWQRLCSAELKAERTFLAIADRPINLFIEGSIEESPDQSTLPQSLQWNATVGLRLNLPGNSPD